MIKVKTKLQEVICALDSVLKGEGWIFSNRIIAKRAERRDLVELLREAKKVIGREEMENWRKALTKTYDVLHYLNIENA